MSDLQPKHNVPELVTTLNKFGYMIPTLDQFQHAFADFAPHSPGVVVEVGSAFGAVTLEVLKRSVPIVANDLDERHLQILAVEAEKLGFSELLTLCPGAFPEDLRFEPGSVGTLLISRVLHFFDGPRIEKAVAQLYQWMGKGGKVFATAETPYLRPLVGFHETYEQRLRDGDPWPGLIEDYPKWCPSYGQELPDMMNFMDVPVLERVFRQAGFEIEKVNRFERVEYPDDLRYDGRESVGIIAIKNA